VAIGKTRIEVGMILGLAPRTVNHHLTSACMKLDVINTHAAVTRLFLLGMMQPASSGPSV
jgi:DNA-binding CsgD family transcriptional regulator